MVGACASGCSMDIEDDYDQEIRKKEKAERNLQQINEELGELSQQIEELRVENAHKILRCAGKYLWRGEYMRRWLVSLNVCV